MTKKNWKIFIIAGGFYFFGEEVQATAEGYISMKNCSMFGGFSGGKGLPGVTRGDKEAKVTLDRFTEDDVQDFPISSCYGILGSINLYEFKGATLR